MNDQEIIMALVRELHGIIEMYASEIGVQPEECVGGHFQPAREILTIAEKRLGLVYN